MRDGRGGGIMCLKEAMTAGCDADYHNHDNASKAAVRCLIMDLLVT